MMTGIYQAKDARNAFYSNKRRLSRSAEFCQRQFQFQNNTIEQLSSGYRINQSGDDAAGLATANQYAGTVATLTQGVLNANNSLSTLQIADGGISNISTILGRLQTLATESASSTFAGNRTTVNNEYQGLLQEVNRQAAAIGLNTGGVNNSNLTTYVGGGSNGDEFASERQSERQQQRRRHDGARHCELQRGGWRNDIHQ